MHRYHLTILLSVVILGASIFGTASYLSGQGILVRTPAPTVTTDGKITNTILVNGEGKVYATPDMVEINITATELSKTSKEAQTIVNQRIQQIMEVLKDQGIPEKDIQTVELSVTPEYDYGTTRTLLGQRATQRLNVKMKKITPQNEKITTVIDKVTELNGIEVGSIVFDIEDKTALFSSARELAFQKAKQKAIELAKLGEVSLLKPVTISDAAVEYYPPVLYRNQFAADSSLTSNGGSSVALGQLEVSVRLDVTWGIQ